MAAREQVPAGLVASTLLKIGDQVDDQADDQAESRGDRSGRRARTQRIRTDEKGRSRNLVIPDSLYDSLYLYARKTKVKVRPEKRINGRVVEKELVRSMTVSEAACKAIAAFLPKRLTIVEESGSPADE
jgi:hypothetical protein